jgi:hypothetical protein
LLGAFIVIGHNVLRVLPNEVPILFVLGLVDSTARWRLVCHGIQTANVVRFKSIGGQPFPRQNLVGKRSASAGTERCAQPRSSLALTNFRWHQPAIEADIPEHANF